MVIPLVYDIALNQTNVTPKEMNVYSSAVSQHLNRLTRSGQMDMQRCTIFPSVQDLLYNLSLPNEPVQPGAVQAAGGQHLMAPVQQAAMVNDLPRFVGNRSPELTSLT
jgi:hypothetical protein